MNGPRVPGDKKDTVALMEKGLLSVADARSKEIPGGRPEPISYLRGLPMHRAAAIMNDGEATENERARKPFDSAQDDPKKDQPLTGHINNRLINEIWETMRTDEIRRWAL